MEIQDQTWYVFFAFAIILIIGLAIVIVFLYKKIQIKNNELKKKQTSAYKIGISQTKGDIYQILGTFSILADYDQLGFISTVSKQMSVDMIGIKEDRIDFIEFKKKGAGVSANERNVKKLVETGKVYYQIKDIELPEGLNVQDRQNNKLPKG